MKVDAAKKALAAEKLERDLMTPQGRYEVGQTMLEPFREGRDYTSIGRKFLAVHHVEPGAPMWYDLDPQFSATVIAKLGGVPKVLDGQKYDRVELDPFIISTLVRVHVTEPSIRRFDVLDREQTRAAAEMAEVEDTEIFKALRVGANTGSGVSNGVSTNTAQSGATFALTKLADAFAQIEHNADTNVENILMNAKAYRNFRILDNTNAAFDPVSRRELVKTGYFGDLWNSRVWVSKKQDNNEILLAASPEFLGVIGVRIDLSMMDAPGTEGLLYYGMLFYEFLAMAVLTNVGAAVYTYTSNI